MPRPVIMRPGPVDFPDDDWFTCCGGDPGVGHTVGCQNDDPRCGLCGRDYEGCECEESR